MLISGALAGAFRLHSGEPSLAATGAHAFAAAVAAAAVAAAAALSLLLLLPRPNIELRARLPPPMGETLIEKPPLALLGDEGGGGPTVTANGVPAGLAPALSPESLGSDVFELPLTVRRCERTGWTSLAASRTNVSGEMLFRSRLGGLFLRQLVRSLPTISISGLSELRFCCGGCDGGGAGATTFDASAIAAAAARMPLSACAAVSCSSRRSASSDMRFAIACVDTSTSCAMRRGSSSSTEGTAPTFSRCWSAAPRLRTSVRSATLSSPSFSSSSDPLRAAAVPLSASLARAQRARRSGFCDPCRARCV